MVCENSINNNKLSNSNIIFILKDVSRFNLVGVGGLEPHLCIEKSREEQNRIFTGTNGKLSSKYIYL